jgi:hypothetical protein
MYVRVPGGVCVCVCGGGGGGRWLDLALTQLERKTYLHQLSLAGLVCYTRNAKLGCDDGTPRKITMITAPNDVRQSALSKFDPSLSVGVSIRAA